MKKEKSVWPDGRITSDWYENAGLGMEMQQLSNCCISMTVDWCGTPDRPDLSICMTAVAMPQADAGPVHSVSVRQKASSANYSNWKALVTFLLYQLDFELSAVGEAGSDSA